MVYSAAQSPLNGLVQIADKSLGTQWLPKVQMITAPAPTEAGSAAWHGQVLGGAAGVACDFLILRKLCGRTSVELSRAESIKRAALTGAILNGVFRPTDADEHFLTGRVRATALGAVSFGSLAAMQGPIDKVLAKGGVKSPFLSGVLSGVPVGAGEAWLNNISGGKPQNLAESAYASALTGGILSQVHAYGRTPAEAKLCKSVSESSKPQLQVLDRTTTVATPCTMESTNGAALRKHLGLVDTEPLKFAAPERALSEAAHEQSNQWISSQMISGDLKAGVRIAPGFGEAISANGQQRRARYALIEVDETRDRTLQVILNDANQRFGALRAHPAMLAEELGRYVRRICNPNNEGAALESRAEAFLSENAGKTIPLGESILRNNCLCIQQSLLYKKLADSFQLPTTLRSAALPFGQHAWSESLINKQWRVYDSARAVYDAPSYIQSGRRR